MCVLCGEMYTQIKMLIQARGIGPLELELQVFVNHLTWVLGNEVGFYTRTLHALNC